jgi:tetratricopeptide (TPR) repeat protein
MDEGLRLAERSLDLYPANGVAVHSVAHVYYEMSQDDEGASFLGGWLEDYDRRSTYRVHLSWHQALFELAMGRYNQALGWYERDIRPSVQELKYAALADSASLVWRMKIYGDVSPQAPWDELVQLAAPAAARPGPSFRDAHAALAFTAAGDDESFGRLVDGLQAMADAGDATAREATLPLIKGIGAFGRGDYGEAVSLMEPVYPQLTRVGGSHAQRLVFEDTLLEAYLRAEEFDKATGMLRERLSRRESPRELYWLARAQHGQGNQEDSNRNASQVKETWEQADPNTPEFARLTQLAAD